MPCQQSARCRPLKALLYTSESAQTQAPAHDDNMLHSRPCTKQDAQLLQQADHVEETAGAGLLEQAASWLHQLVVTLNAVDRLKLFETCMQLAIQVVSSAPSDTLKLCKASSDPLDSRRNSIAKILSTRREVEVTLVTAGPLPFPAVLSSKVTKLCIIHLCNLAMSPWLSWGTLTQLQSLSIKSMATESELMSLCVALEAGHLQQLNELSFDDHSLSRPCSQRFALALGARIKTLRLLTAGFSLHYILHLPALQTLILDVATISPAACTIVCRHPSLHTVKLFHNQWCLDSWGSEHSCRWSSLHVAGLSNPKPLLTMQFESLQELHILYSIAIGTELDAQGFCVVVKKFLDRIHLQPAYNTYRHRHYFAILNLTTDTLPLVSRLHASCWLHLHFSLGDQGPTFLPALWAALSHSCYGVHLHGVTGVDWRTFWHGIPGHVRHVELSSVSFDSQASPDASILSSSGIHSLVAATPVHVESLSFQNMHIESLEAARVRQAAPGHLKLKLPSRII